MKWNESDIGTQEGRIVIVTGANSGIGFETARLLVANGARVVLACRNEEKGREALERMEGDVEFRALDLSDLGSVETFASAFTEQYKGLDLLINNAGVMMPPFGRTKDGFELQFGTNHLGHFALTARLFPLMKERPGARIVNVSSNAHKFGRIDFEDLHFEKRYRKMASYGQSKLANLLFTYELDRRLREAGSEVIAVAAHPGWTATNLQDETPSIRFLNPLMAMKPVGGALPTLRAAVDPEVKGAEYYGPKGVFEMRGAPVKVASNRRSHDRDVARRLWEISEDLTGVPFTV